MRPIPRFLFAVWLLATLASPAPPLAAQAAATPSAEAMRANYEAHRGDFDYLLGDWEYTAVHHDYGRYRGYWSAVRLPDGAQVLDEYRVVGDSGETIYVTRTLRSYNAAADRWELVGMDEANGLQDLGTGRRVGNEVHIEQRFGVITGSPSTLRIRYHDIQPDRFSWTADRTRDGGRTWEPNHLVIEARRIGPARFLPQLAPARQPGRGGP